MPGDRPRAPTRAPGDPAQAAERGGEAHRGEHLQAAAEAIQVQHLPALLRGDAPEVGVGVDDHRVAHGAQHRQVRLGVRVGVGGGQVDALALGQLAHREHLALAVVEGPGRPARVAAVDDLRARAEAAVEGEHVRQQIGHLLGGRGQDVHGHARVLVGVGAREHLRVQPREHAREHPRREPLQVADAHAGDHLPDAPAHVVGAIVGRAAQAEAQVLVGVARQAAARDHPRLIGGAGEEDARGAGHQRLVEVEERRRRATRAPGAVAAVCH